MQADPQFLSGFFDEEAFALLPSGPDREGDRQSGQKTLQERQLHQFQRWQQHFASASSRVPLSFSIVELTVI